MVILKLVVGHPSAVEEHWVLLLLIPDELSAVAVVLFVLFRIGLFFGGSSHEKQS